ncbi:PREDICTED: DNA ligase 1-like [Atta cephalotes]|uniref:Reverse transcriptase domain-containing protein n=1 Tax=Atta cephalotes TaxID=12957 RepID=A0A158P151_ATTCE|nr:PREDICTED: DNA ligase 1-like [Atta cephalotes]
MKKLETVKKDLSENNRKMESLEDRRSLGKAKENDAEENQNEENRISKKEEIIVWNKETIESYNKNTEVINDEEDMDKETGKKYLEKRKEFRELLKKKQKEKREEEEEELKKLKKKADLLDGTEMDENKVQQNTGQLSKLEEEKVNIYKKENEEEGLKVEEIGKAFCKIKKKKAARKDGVPMEAWIYADESLRKRQVKLLQKVWNTGKMPQNWKESIIVPLYKRGDEEKRERNQEEGRRKIYMFANLKAIFDKMDRGIFWETLRGKGVNKYLVRKIEKMYEETEDKDEARIHATIQNNERSKAGLCDESMFNLHIADT